MVAFLSDQGLRKTSLNPDGGGEKRDAAVNRFPIAGTQRIWFEIKARGMPHLKKTSLSLKEYHFLFTCLYPRGQCQMQTRFETLELLEDNC